MSTNNDLENVKLGMSLVKMSSNNDLENVKLGRSLVTVVQI